MELNQPDVELLKCPRCREWLIRIRNEKDMLAEGYTWSCINWRCRGMNPEFPVFYGYTQKDIDENEAKKNLKIMGLLWVKS